MTLWLGVKDFAGHVAGRIFGRLLPGLAEDEALKGSAFTFVAPLTGLLLSVAVSSTKPGSIKPAAVEPED